MLEQGLLPGVVICLSLSQFRNLYTDQCRCPLGSGDYGGGLLQLGRPRVPDPSGILLGVVGLVGHTKKGGPSFRVARRAPLR